MTFITLLKLVRAPAGFTAVSNIIAAAVIASAGQLTFDVIWLVCASVCFYFAGMALNDCFDYKIDLAERANRPIPLGDISLNKAWGVGFGLLSAGLILSFIHSAIALYVGLCLSASILLYNGLIKNGFMGSIFMACCRYFNWLLGACVLTLSANSYYFALPVFFYIVGLTYLSKQEVSAKNKNVLWLTFIMLILTAVSLFLLITQLVNHSSNHTYIACLLVSIWLVVMSKKLITIYRDFTPTNIQNMIMWLIIGVIPLDALIVTISGHYGYAILILLLLPPCRFFGKRLAMT
jgi:hypothetical protein